MQMHAKPLNTVAVHRPSVVLLILNLVGAVGYVLAASRGWRIPQERGLVPVTGEPYIWAMSVFPICVAFFILNLAWGAFILARKQWQSGTLWLFIFPIWLIAIAMDFTHH
jgi:hypothetical protein